MNTIGVKSALRSLVLIVCVLISATASAHWHGGGWGGGWHGGGWHGGGWGGGGVILGFPGYYGGYGGYYGGCERVRYCNYNGCWYRNYCY